MTRGFWCLIVVCFFVFLSLLNQSRSRHSAHSSLMAKSPMASGHQLSSQRVNLQSAQPSYARMKHGHPASSSHFSSFASSGYSLQSSHDDGSLPNIDGKVRHGASHEYQKRKEEERRHLNRHQQHLNNEIGSLVESYLAPHQPAGYGHSIKDVSLHKEMHRYRLQKWGHVFLHPTPPHPTPFW